MTTYNAIYTLGIKEIHKSTEAKNIYEAKKKFSSPEMLPNEFFHDYEGMELLISEAENPDLILAVLNYNDIKSM